MRTTEEWAQLYLDEVASKYAKDIKLKSKANPNWLLKLIAPIVGLFNDSFMTGYITTLGNTIWYPEGWLDRGDVKSRLSTIAHECIHIKQGAEQGSVLHAFLYLFPQSLAVLSLLAFLAIPFGLWWLLCLLFLLCLAPIPAPFRYMKELEAYRVKLIFFKYAWNSNDDMMRWAKDHVIKNMSSSDYYFCWPFKNRILKDLNNKKALEKEQYQEIVEFLERHNLLAGQ